MARGPRKLPALPLLFTVLLAMGPLAHRTRAEIAQQGSVRVAFEGAISPRALPRLGTAPIAVSVGGHISTTDRSSPPQLRKIEIAINRHGHLDTTLPSCRLKRIQPSTTKDALKACRAALVGDGSFSANVVLPGQAPFPSKGRVLAFNGRLNGRPTIFAHVFGTKPVPTSYTLPFEITHSRGVFATVLSASLPRVTSDVGFVTGLSLNLDRKFRYRGRIHSYLSAGCPAPAGFSGAAFPLLRASFAFDEGKTLSSTLTRSCRARG